MAGEGRARARKGTSSWPGLTRPSQGDCAAIVRMPCHRASRRTSRPGGAAWMAGSSPAMTGSCKAARSGVDERGEMGLGFVEIDRAGHGGRLGAAGELVKLVNSPACKSSSLRIPAPRRGAIKVSMSLVRPHGLTTILKSRWSLARPNAPIAVQAARACSRNASRF